MDYASGFKRNQIIAENQSLGANYSSSTYVPSEIKEAKSYCAFAIVTGATALNGTFSLQASPDGQNWAPIPNTSQTVSALAGNAVYYLFDPIPLPSYPFVQLVWTYSSGSGTLSIAYLSQKQ
jgi:hypothetical protein